MLFIGHLPNYCTIDRKPFVSGSISVPWSGNSYILRYKVYLKLYLEVYHDKRVIYYPLAFSKKKYHANPTIFGVTVDQNMFFGHYPRFKARGLHYAHAHDARTQSGFLGHQSRRK